MGHHPGALGRTRGLDATYPLQVVCRLSAREFCPYERVAFTRNESRVKFAQEGRVSEKAAAIDFTSLQTR